MCVSKILLYEVITETSIQRVRVRVRVRVRYEVITETSIQRNGILVLILASTRVCAMQVSADRWTGLPATLIKHDFDRTLR